jgi:hypothetical protein
MEIVTGSDSFIPLILHIDSVVAGLLWEFAAMSKSVEKKGCLVARLTALGEQGPIHLCMQYIPDLLLPWFCNYHVEKQQR